jgi:molybdopterin/thiamine biosynthesis adenylyltransferase/rhodanese-related sulfurtransferase
MSKTYAEQLAEARAATPMVSNDQAQALVAGGALLLDVREADEWAAGHLPGAVFLPRSQVAGGIAAIEPDRGRPFVVYCASGIRSAFAAQQLLEMGYRDVVNMVGGYAAWQAEGRATEGSPRLTMEQRRRYSRHLLVPEVGSQGQAKLLDAKVLFIGAGGLGSPALLYLAAAGVGTIGIVDFDVVDASNLQRQIIHSTERIGQKKTDSAALAIRALNPDVRVIGHDEMLTDDNVDRLIAGYDIVLDGTDTFETRYTLNDAAVRARIPVVHASVFRFEGQLTAFVPYEGPCYRCLYPTPPPPELAPGCSVAGVLGVVPGTMGILQATEAIKLLLGIGDPLVGRLLIYDALDATFQELKLRRDPACPACGDAVRAAPAASAAPKAPSVVASPA